MNQNREHGRESLIPNHNSRNKFVLDGFDLDPLVEDKINTEFYKLRKRLDEADDNCCRAALAGKQLLQDKQELNYEIKQLQNRVESLEQEKYSLTLKLTNTDLNQTLDYDALLEKLTLKDQLISKLHAKDKEMEREINNMKEEICELEEKQGEMLDVIYENKKQIDTLHGENNDLKTRIEIYSSNSINNNADMSEIEIDSLKVKNEQLAKCYIKCNEDIREKNKTIDLLKSQILKLESELSFKDDEIKSFSCLTEETNRKLEECKEEIEMLKLVQIDPTKRGNCLFSEVEDHRKLLERKVATLTAKNDTLNSKYQQACQQLVKLKTQLNTAMCIKKQNVDHSYMQELEHSLSQSRIEISELNILLKKARDNANSGYVLHYPKDMTSSDHCKLLLDKARLDSEAKTKEIKELRFRNSGLSEDLINNQNQLYQTQKQTEALKSQVISLKEQLNSLRNKRNSGSVGDVPKATYMVEKIHEGDEVFPLEVQPVAVNQILPEKNVLNPQKKVSWSTSPNFCGDNKSEASGNERKCTKNRKSANKTTVIKDSEIESVAECKQQ